MAFMVSMAGMIFGYDTGLYSVKISVHNRFYLGD